MSYHVQKATRHLIRKMATHQKCNLRVHLGSLVKEVIFDTSFTEWFDVHLSRDLEEIKALIHEPTMPKGSMFVMIKDPGEEGEEVLNWWAGG